MNLEKLIGFVHDSMNKTPEARVLKTISNRNAREIGHFDYIPIDDKRMSKIIDDIIKNNKTVKDKSNLKFCDAGCGIPVIVKTMKLLGFDSSIGLEYEKNYVEHYRYDGVEQADIIDHDFSKYDCIYSYNPLCEQDLMDKALVNILTTMKKGATLYFVQAMDLKTKFSDYGEVINVDGRSSIIKVVKK